MYRFRANANARSTAAEVEVEQAMNIVQEAAEVHRVHVMVAAEVAAAALATLPVMEGETVKEVEGWGMPRHKRLKKKRNPPGLVVEAVDLAV